ncbi:HAMP domain-containing histidine kinase [Tissierella creatinini]|nr:HAMP domain-containing histidine kinase [Tissierella creatinini]TJX65579.1 HAMP domain-containing histidine kinase [Soehngenia saccharolytica]
MKFFDKESIKFKLWTYFIALSAVIMVLLWLLQTVFLNQFYESMKTNEIKKIGNSLVQQYGKEGFEDLLYTTSLSEGIVIQILDGDGNLVYPLNLIDILRQPRLDYKLFSEFLINLLNSENNHVIYYREDIRFSGPTLVYGAILKNEGSSNYFLYINSILQPVDSTVNVLQKQLIIVTIISLGMGLILSYAIATKLTKPIEEITESAKSLAQGDYNIVFNKGDYTEINNLADTLNYATKELSKTEELRRDLIANVSHDLRTPLTLIKSYGEMIRDISGNNEIKRNSHIKTIIDEADRLTILVNDMMDLSKAQSGLENLGMVSFDIKKTTEDILTRFKYFEDKYGYSFILNSKGEAKVLGDESKIQQVIYNLLSNAVNYSTDMKEITINIEDEGSNVLFQVRDRGVGIPEDQLANIWDRYYKVGKSHKRSISGSGIGLSIVKSILMAHKSEYGVESKLDEGSTFFFKLKKSL